MPNVFVCEDCNASPVEPHHVQDIHLSVSGDQLQPPVVTQGPGGLDSNFADRAMAHTFRVFMLEKFRELDAELQRTTALDPMRTEQLHPLQQIASLDAHYEEYSDRMGLFQKPSPNRHVKIKTNPGDGPVRQMIDVCEPLDVTTVTSEPKFRALPSAGQIEEAHVCVVSPQSPSPRWSQMVSSGTLLSSQDAAPKNAFVINVRRLIEAQEKLLLLHDLLKSTAIAGITLVAAGTQKQFFATCLFLPIIFTLFAMHEQDFDHLEIEDFKMLLPLLCDDVALNYAGANPNRLFKAVSTESSRVVARLGYLFHVVLLFGLIYAWNVLEYSWRNPPSLGSSRQHGGFLHADWWISDEEDANVIGMQVTVTTLMFVLQASFQYIHWRETSAVMPLTANNETWDPRRHGTPPKYWLFGMPSMWFTSTEALMKLKMYIQMANPASTGISKIYPQELAYYALSGDEERAELQRALNESKLFDACQQSIIFDGDEPRTLELGLCFFDDKLQHKMFPCPGEFMYYQDIDRTASTGGEDPVLSRPSHMVIGHQNSSRSVLRSQH